MNERNPHSGSAFQAIRAIDYTVIFARETMRRFVGGFQTATQVGNSVGPPLTENLRVPAT